MGVRTHRTTHNYSKVPPEGTPYARARGQRPMGSSGRGLFGVASTEPSDVDTRGYRGMGSSGRGPDQDPIWSSRWYLGPNIGPLDESSRACHIGPIDPMRTEMTAT